LCARRAHAPAAEARVVRLTARERLEAHYQSLRFQGRAARRGRCSAKAAVRTTVAGGPGSASNETTIRGSGVRVRGGRQPRHAASGWAGPGCGRQCGAQDQAAGCSRVGAAAIRPRTGWIAGAGAGAAVQRIGRGSQSNQRLQRRSRPPYARLTPRHDLGTVSPGRWAAGPPLRRDSLGRGHYANPALCLCQ